MTNIKIINSDEEIHEALDAIMNTHNTIVYFNKKDNQKKYDKIIESEDTAVYYLVSSDSNIIGWYFYDETYWIHGPYATEWQAEGQYRAYCHYLENGH